MLAAELLRAVSFALSVLRSHLLSAHLLHAPVARVAHPSRPSTPLTPHAHPSRPMQCLGARIALAPSGLRGAKPVRQARPFSRVAASELVDTDVNALRAWREQCPELHALWDESKPVTKWQGVKFGKAGGADAGQVVKIQLQNFDLTGDVPVELGGLTALKGLMLRENRLTSVPAALGGLTALKTLDLGRNQLTSVPVELGTLTALTTLDLHGNQLTSVPVELGALTALETLNLRENLLTSVPAELGALTALQTLILSKNQLTSVPAELGGLTALIFLDLYGNPLTSVPAEWEEGGALDEIGAVSR